VTASALPPIPVELYPAIDIRHGRVVRLSQGEATRPVVYESDPVAQAERFVAEGLAVVAPAGRIG
jgi:phosphoribosylformimino-5-aminoimidazole carboxamide ribonucleotide (ProFAR) isomerase